MPSWTAPALCPWNPFLVDRLVDRPLCPLAAADSAYRCGIFCAACPQPPAPTVGEFRWLGTVCL
jgi:hypothetical protein